MRQMTEAENISSEQARKKAKHHAEKLIEILTNPQLSVHDDSEDMDNHLQGLIDYANNHQSQVHDLLTSLDKTSKLSPTILGLISSFVKFEQANKDYNLIAFLLATIKNHYQTPLGLLNSFSQLMSQNTSFFSAVIENTEALDAKGKLSLLMGFNFTKVILGRMLSAFDPCVSRYTLEKFLANLSALLYECCLVELQMSIKEKRPCSWCNSGIDSWIFTLAPQEQTEQIKKFLYANQELTDQDREAIAYKILKDDFIANQITSMHSHDLLCDFIKNNRFKLEELTCPETEKSLVDLSILESLGLLKETAGFPIPVQMLVNYWLRFIGIHNKKLSDVVSVLAKDLSSLFDQPVILKLIVQASEAENSDENAVDDLNLIEEKPELCKSLVDAFEFFLQGPVKQLLVTMLTLSTVENIVNIAGVENIDKRGQVIDQEALKILSNLNIRLLIELKDYLSTHGTTIQEHLQNILEDMGTAHTIIGAGLFNAISINGQAVMSSLIDRLKAIDVQGEDINLLDMMHSIKAIVYVNIVSKVKHDGEKVIQNLKLTGKQPAYPMTALTEFEKNIINLFEGQDSITLQLTYLLYESPQECPALIHQLTTDRLLECINEPHGLLEYEKEGRQPKVLEAVKKYIESERKVDKEQKRGHFDSPTVAEEASVSGLDVINGISPVKSCLEDFLKIILGRDVSSHVLDVLSFLKMDLDQPIWQALSPIFKFGHDMISFPVLNSMVELFAKEDGQELAGHTQPLYNQWQQLTKDSPENQASIVAILQYAFKLCQGAAPNLLLISNQFQEVLIDKHNQLDQSIKHLIEKIFEKKHHSLAKTLLTAGNLQVLCQSIQTYYHTVGLDKQALNLDQCLIRWSALTYKNTMKKIQAHVKALDSDISHVCHLDQHEITSLCIIEGEQSVDLYRLLIGINDPGIYKRLNSEDKQKIQSFMQDDWISKQLTEFPGRKVKKDRDGQPYVSYVLSDAIKRTKPCVPIAASWQGQVWQLLTGQGSLSSWIGFIDGSQGINTILESVCVDVDQSLGRSMTSLLDHVDQLGGVDKLESLLIQAFPDIRVSEHPLSQSQTNKQSVQITGLRVVTGLKGKIKTVIDSVPYFRQVARESTIQGAFLYGLSLLRRRAVYRKFSLLGFKLMVDQWKVSASLFDHTRPLWRRLKTAAWYQIKVSWQACRWLLSWQYLKLVACLWQDALRTIGSAIRHGALFQLPRMVYDQVISKLVLPISKSKSVNTTVSVSSAVVLAAGSVMSMLSPWVGISLATTVFGWNHLRHWHQQAKSACRFFSSSPLLSPQRAEAVMGKADQGALKNQKFVHKYGSKTVEFERIPEAMHQL